MILTLCFLASCESPFDPGDLSEPRMALSATASPTQGFLAFISPVQGLSTNQESSLIDNATIKLFEDGLEINPLVLDSLGTRKVYYAGIIPKVGSTYTLKIDAPGYVSIEVADIQTNQAEAQFKGYTSLDSTNLPDGAVRYIAYINIEINDQPDVMNYYHMFMEAHLLDNNNNRYFTLATLNNAQNNDPAITPYLLNQSLLLDGEAFNGLKKELQILSEFTVPAGLTFQNVQIDFRHVSNAYYQFHKSHVSQITSGNNPVAEPSSLYTNVQKGYGFFGCYNSTRDTLNF